MGEQVCRPILPVVLAVRVASVRARLNDHHSVVAGGYPATNCEMRFCEQREEGPACVESCPTQALSCLLKENSGESASSVLLPAVESSVKEISALKGAENLLDCQPPA